MTERPTYGADTCQSQPATGDLTCNLPAYHEGLHRNWQGIAWSISLENPDDPAQPKRMLDRPLTVTRRELGMPEPGKHARREPAPPSRIAQAHALLSAVETLKATSGAVEIAGVRIEACDEYGRTATTDRCDALEAKHAAAVEYIDELEARLTRVLAVAGGTDQVRP